MSAHQRFPLALGLASAIVLASGVILLAYAVFPLFAWSLVAFGVGLAVAALVRASQRHILGAPRVLMLVLLAPVFAMSYLFGRLIFRGTTMSWAHTAELAILFAVVVAGMAGGLSLTQRGDHRRRAAAQ